MSTTTTTWSDLPIEMISEVIKHLDFKSRMMLRATARTEKMIVEATKMNIHYVSVSGQFPGGPHVFAGGSDWTPDEEIGGFEGEEEKLISLMTSLIRYTKITQFQLSADHRRRTFMGGSIGFLEKVTERAGKFKFPVFNVNHFDDSDFHRTFELCEPGIEYINLHRPPKLGLERVFRDPQTLPVVLGASIIQIDDYENLINWVNVIMEAWIKNNQVVGKKVLFWISEYNDKDKWEYERDEQPEEDVLMTGFKSKFEERVVEETSKSIRIRMDNTENHILMRIHEEEGDNGDTRVLAIWEVVPMDLTEDRYSKNSGYIYVEC